MKRNSFRARFAASLFLLISAAITPHFAQENATAELEAAGRSIMSDPRLRNVLRSVKEDPGAALEGVKKDPEEAVREATRIFQENTEGIDPEKLKAAAAKAQTDGTLDAARSKVSEMLPKEAAAAIPTSTPAAVGAPATIPVETLPTSTKPAITVPPTVAPADEVPATRPAPGISGGVPTPVAMPLESGAPIVATPAASRSADALPSAVAAATGTVVQESTVRAIAGAAPTTPMIPDAAVLNANDVPEPVPLAKKYEHGPNGGYPSADRKHMEILSKESIMDNTKGVLLFTGNVFINHPDFEIKCDKLEIQLADGVGMEGSEEGQSDANFKRAIASGGMVEIKRIAVDEKGKKKTQIALARIADYNAVTKDIILSGGPPYIQDGDRFVKTNSEDAQIIMRGNGLYEITGSTNRSTIVIPIENKGGVGGEKGKKKGGNNSSIGTGLEGTFDRFR